MNFILVCAALSLIFGIRDDIICFWEKRKKCCYNHVMRDFCEICPYKRYSKEEAKEIHKLIDELED